MVASNKRYSRKALYYGMPARREIKLLELIGNVTDKKILDVGCASGYFGGKLERMGAKVTGIDSSGSAIRKAKRIMTNALVVDLNEKNVPLESNSFDIIVASEVIEHLINPLNTLNELNRILKKNGMLLVTTPNLMYWGNRIKFLKGEFRYQKSGMFDEGHIHFFTYGALKEDLEKSKFQILEESHIYQGNGILNGVKKYFPGVFAYQIVVKCIKSKS